MNLKFRGNYISLKNCVARTKVDGDWRHLDNHQKQYSTDDGAVLNWWATTGTISFQGRDKNKDFENAFINEASAKNRLKVKLNNPGLAQQKEQPSLRTLVKDAQAAIAELKWSDLREQSPAQQITIANGLIDIATLIRRL